MITLNISDLLPIFSFDMWRRLDRYYQHHLKEEKSRVVERPILGLELRLNILDEALLTLPCCLLALSLRKSLENVWWDQKHLWLVGSQWQAQQPALPDLSWSDGWLSWCLRSGEEIGTTAQRQTWRRHRVNGTDTIYARPRKWGHTSARWMRPENMKDTRNRKEKSFLRATLTTPFHCKPKGSRLDWNKRSWGGSQLREMGRKSLFKKLITVSLQLQILIFVSRGPLTKGNWKAMRGSKELGSWMHFLEHSAYPCLQSKGTNIFTHYQIAE